MENIVRTIRVYYPVSDEALATLAHGFEKQVFPVKTLIIRAGQFDRQVHFIEKGMTRSYTLHDGKEVTTWFSMEGDVACGSWDLYRNKAGFEYVETLEETLVYSISIETLNELYKSDRYCKLDEGVTTGKFSSLTRYSYISPQLVCV